MLMSHAIKITMCKLTINPKIVYKVSQEVYLGHRSAIKLFRDRL